MTPKEMTAFMEKIIATVIMKPSVKKNEELDQYELSLVVFDREYSLVIDEKTARDTELVKKYWAQLSSEFYKELTAGVEFLAAQHYQAMKDKGELAEPVSPQPQQSTPAELLLAETDTASH